MDSAQGVGRAAGAGDDWRAHLKPESRVRVVDRMVNRIIEATKNNQPVSVPERLSELQKYAVQFEEKTYAAATSQSDYLRKISLKVLSMESRSMTCTQQNPWNTQVVENQRLHGLVELPVVLQFRGSESNIEGTNEQSSAQHRIDRAKGADPAADAGGEWHSHLQPEARERIVNRIMEGLKKHLPVSDPDGLSELKKIATRFEEKTYGSAISQSDYLRKISLKMLSLESQTNTQEKPQNAQVVQNQRHHGLASVDSTTQPDNTGANNSQEELHQMNDALKDQFLAGLCDLHEMFMELHADSPPQNPTDQSEDMKSFKLMLERSLHSLESTPMYKRHVTSIINSEGWKKKLQQSAGQAASTSSSAVLSHESSNVKRLRPSPNDDIHS